MQKALWSKKKKKKSVNVFKIDGGTNIGEINTDLNFI